MSTSVPLQDYAERYLVERHQLGYGLGNRYAIRSFARYVDGLDHEGPLTVELMVSWAQCAKTNSDNPTTWARRLKALRPFVRWLKQYEPRHDVPDDTLFGRVDRRLAPHIYSEQEIIDLLMAARRLHPVLRGATYETLFGLLAATGLRVSEAVHLMDADVDLKAGLLFVRQTKFAKSRQVPLHPSTTKALRRYRELRNRQVEVAEEMPFFVGTRGQRRGYTLGLRQVRRVFITLREQLGWINRGAHAAPRIHDLRHTFVVRRILLWQAQGVDVDQAMLSLSTYVGHAKITNTYWYLTGVPDLMAVAAAQFEAIASRLEVHHG
ncbi:tyrosine-type recombinase/integrase [Marinobacterium aestuariivivens]|uniref:Tyrosine-type recombinase/integrase n=1 Tax=Marinobacterium aestuariivivens TaxID=1698799 RepID=A0ABW2A9F8_9GAMM